MIKRKKQTGFTLVEILIALAIFAIIGIAAATCLHQMIYYRNRLTSQAGEWRMLAITRLLMQKDISNTIHLDDQDLGAPLLPLFSGQSTDLTLTRWNHAQTAWIKDMPLFIGVKYSLADGDLQRTIMLPGGKNFSSVIAQDISSIKWHYLDNNQQWQSSWQSTSSTTNTDSNNTVTSLPQAIRVTLVIKNVGTIQWDFAKPVVSG